MNRTLVTGGAKGLGAAICKMLAAKGHSVVVHYNHSADEAENVVRECRQLGVEAELIQGDLSSQENTDQFIKKYLQRFSKTENLINNVGNYLVGKATETSIQEWHDLFQTNFFAPIALIHATLPQIKQARGHVINIGVAGIDSFRADTYMPAYKTAKLNLWMLTKSLAKELANSGVRVNMVSPGQLENSIDLNKEKLPMGRPGSCEEVANLIAFLLDPKNCYITGQNIEVAGGYCL